MKNTDSIGRRSFVRGTVLAFAAGAIPATAAPPRPEAQLTAQQRYELHLAGLVAAMDELTAGADGWNIYGGRDVTGRAWCRRLRNDLVAEPMRPGSVQMIRVERHTDLDYPECGRL